MKKCTRCNCEKPKTMFSRGARCRDGLSDWCKGCVKKYHDGYYAINRKEILANHKIQRLRTRYGISVKIYEDMYKTQGGRCAICKNPFPAHGVGRLQIDHCHETNVIRGLLCQLCNRALGCFYDDIDSLNNAIEYISRDKTEMSSMEQPIRPEVKCA